MAPTASYAIDRDDRIVWTDDGFADLARGHGQPELAEQAVGRPLADFVSGERPRALQKALIARARRAPGTEPLELRYRCDSPEMRRHAVLQLRPQPDGTLVFTTWFDATEPRPYQHAFDYARSPGDYPAQLCAWCNRFGTEDGWHEAEDLPTTPAVEHGLCEICELLLTSRPGAGPKWSGPSGRP